MAGLLMQPHRSLVAKGSFGLLPAALKRMNVPAIDTSAPANARGHKNFGHKNEKTPQFTKFYHLIVGSIFVITIVDWKK